MRPARTPAATPETALVLEAVGLLLVVVSAVLLVLLLAYCLTLSRRSTASRHDLGASLERGQTQVEMHSFMQDVHNGFDQFKLK